jgi:hypothetical protein
MSDKSSLELISDITEFNDLHDFMKDEQLDRAMAVIINIIAKPDIPAAKAHLLIVELQGISAKFGVLAAYYTTIAKDKAGTINNNKKNIYYSVKESIDKLVDALKYVVRYNG